MDTGVAVGGVAVVDFNVVVDEIFPVAVIGSGDVALDAAVGDTLVLLLLTMLEWMLLLLPLLESMVMIALQPLLRLLSNMRVKIAGRHLFTFSDGIFFVKRMLLLSSMRRREPMFQATMNRCHKKVTY